MPSRTGRQRRIATPPPTDIHRRILTAVRRILRRVEIASVELESAHGITIPQLICLRTVIEQGTCSQVELSHQIHLGASTLVGVIDRLEAKGLVVRKRDAVDRRRILIQVTAAGRRKSQESPEPLQDGVVQAIGALPMSRQRLIAGAVEQLVDVLDAHRIEPAPFLASGPIPKPANLEGRGG